jgi:PilZ domain
MAASSNKTNQRRVPRIKATPRGELIKGGNSTKVLLQDISDEGILLICSREFEAGEICELKIQLSPGSLIDCTVEVRHSSDLGTGVKILSMNELSRRILDRYLQEHFSHNHGRLTQ